jgi:hypothetical protein
MLIFLPTGWGKGQAVRHERRVLVAGPAAKNIGFHKQECSIARIAEDVNITGTITEHTIDILL